MGRRLVDSSQTIFALASGKLPSAVAIVKVSGPDAFAIAARLFRPEGGGAFERRRQMTLGRLVDGAGASFDDILALGFVAPHSHTGEDTVELHCHGSPAVVRRLESELAAAGARPAERGEFSHRALLHGRLSAADVERLGDVFLARAGADLDRIYRRQDAALHAEVEALREQLVRLQAILDTAVDFSEEYSAAIHEASRPLDAVILGCSAAIRRYSALSSGENSPRIVLAGRPNAGKSSLFNALLCRYRAIVHSEPGTTRDAIEETVESDGIRWKLVDTAGVREATGPEREGVELAGDFLSAASAWVLVVDGTVGWTEAEADLIRRHGGKPHLIVWNKADLPSWRMPPALPAEMVLPVSALRNPDVTELSRSVQRLLSAAVPPEEGPLPTAVQAARLGAVVGRLDRLKADLGAGVGPEILAEANRRIIADLEGAVGAVGNEDVLDRVFGEFCIGK